MSRAVTLAGYAVLTVVALALEMLARGRGRVATFGTVLADATRTPLVRIAVLAGWLWLGWHLFVRVSWR